MENLTSLSSSDLSATIKKYAPYFKEARKRLFLTLSVIGVSTISGFVFYEQIIKFLIGSLSMEGVNIVFTSPFQFINLAISCGVASGIIVAFPLIIAQILLFLRPALKKREYTMVVRFIPVCLFLFIVGFIFGAVIMKWQIQIFMARSIALGIGNVLDISGLLTTVFLTSVLMGIGFQFPIVLLLLMRLGILKQHQLSSKRPWVYLGSFIFVLFLPPDSVLADILLALPFLFLFEITLIMNTILSRKKRD